MNERRTMQPRDLVLSVIAECGDHDEFGPRELLDEIWESAPKPKRLIWIEGADHFFQGIADSPGPKLDRMQAEIRRWLQDTFMLQDPA